MTDTKITQFENQNCYVTTTGQVYKKVGGKLVEKAIGRKGSGYATTFVKDPDTKKYVRMGVHRLVLHCFTRYTIQFCRRNKLDVMHMDEDKFNNELSNLKAGTRSENAQHYHDNNRKAYYTQALKKRLKRDYEKNGVSISALARKYNTSYTGTYNVINGGV